MTDGMREAYGASKVSQSHTPTPRAVEAELVAEGRALVQALHDKHDASRRKMDDAAERFYAMSDNVTGKDYADKADAHEEKQDALHAFLAHTAAQSRQLAEVRAAIEKLPTRNIRTPDGASFVTYVDKFAVLSLFPRSPETNDAG